MQNIVYPNSWESMSISDKIKEVTSAHSYMMRYFGKYRHAIINKKTYDILKEIHNNGSDKKKP